MDEHTRLLSEFGDTVGEWADAQLRLGNYDCSREELIRYACNQLRDLQEQKKKPVRTFREQCESMEGGMGAG